jgi:hypothetical protein
MLALAAACVLGGSGCSNERDALPKTVRPIGLRYDQFPDLAFPAGWRPLAGEDHVAVAIAGGAARRLDLALQAPPARTDLESGDAMARMVAAILPDSGWIRVGEGRAQDVKQTWKRADETLVVTAERIGGVAVIRWRLVP